MRLLSVGGDTKTVKGEQHGILTAVQYLTPGSKRMCPNAGTCAKVCLNTAGRLRMQQARDAAAVRTHLFLNAREKYLEQLVTEVDRHMTRALLKGMIPAVRLNGTSDISWELIPEVRNMMVSWNKVQYYDYTKDQSRWWSWLSGHKVFPENYDLTYSYSEKTDFGMFRDMLDAVAGTPAAARVKIAVVYQGKVPDVLFRNMKVIKGDDHDATFLQCGPVVLALKAKGDAKKQGRHVGRFVHEF